MIELLESKIQSETRRDTMCEYSTVAVLDHNNATLEMLDGFGGLKLEI